MIKLLGLNGEPMQKTDVRQDAKWQRLETEAGFGVAGVSAYSGQSVSLNKSLSLSTVWACLKVTSQMVASLQIEVFQKNRDGSKERLADHPLEELLNQSPNEDDTGFEYWQRACAKTLANGNDYSEKIELGHSVRGLVPLPNCQPFRGRDGILQFRIQDRGKTEILPRDKVLHLRGFGMGGDLGLSAIRNGVQTFGASLAAEETSGRVFSNGLSTGGVLKAKGELTTDQRNQLQGFLDQYTGSKNTGKTLLLEYGLEYDQISLNPEDAQLLETRRHNIEEQCRWFGTPPVVIGHSPDGQTMWGSGLEQVMLSWLTLGINPILEAFEQRIAKSILSAADRRRLVLKFNRQDMLRMDSKAMSAFISKLVVNAIMTPDEGRAMINKPPMPGGDKLYAQKQLQPLENRNEGQN